MPTPDMDTESEAAVVIDPVEEALAQQQVLWKRDIAELDETIAMEEARLKRMRASRETLIAKIAKIEDHLGENFEGWDVRLAERSGDEPKKEKGKRGG